jgi:hemin uptake protein HemP
MRKNVLETAEQEQYKGRRTSIIDILSQKLAFPEGPVEDRDNVPQPPREAEEERPVVQADELFRGQREIWIELDGVRYRLRITRRNKLILQK